MRKQRRRPKRRHAPRRGMPLRQMDLYRQIRRPWTRDSRTQVHASQPSRAKRKEEERKEAGEEDTAWQ